MTHPVLRVPPALPLLAGLLACAGCSSAPAVPRPLVQPSFSYERDGLHPADAARLAGTGEALAWSPRRAAGEALR